MNDQAFNRFINISLALMALVYVGAMLTMDLINIDSAQYAVISKEMQESGSYLQVFCRGGDYLDKPPLVFWLSSLFISLLGKFDWAFRLPNVLTLVLGVYAFYRFAKIYYDIRVAKLAAVVFSASVATYCMVTDVRTDTMLTGWVMFTFWQLAEFYRNNKLLHMILAAVGIGMAMLAKGPLGLVIPLVAFSCEFVYKRQWRNFFRWEYLVALLVIGIVLFPMSWGLYQQFDLHPEKTVYNLQGPSGLRFYYWTQSFGRITGENYWDNDPDPFFLYHSFAWSFMPWTVFFIPAFYAEAKEKWQGRSSIQKPEIITLAGFTLIFFFLSRSRYQLPHYTFVIHTLAALITAKYLHRLVSAPGLIRAKSAVLGFQYFALALVITVCALIVFFIFPGAPFLGLIVAGTLGLSIWLLTKKPDVFHRSVTVTLVVMICAYIILSTRFYPTLLTYQSDRAIADQINRLDVKDARTIEWHNYCGYAFDFYCNTPVNHIFGPIDGVLRKGKTFIIVKPDRLRDAFVTYPGVEVIGVYPDFSVTQLTAEFLNPKTRSATLNTKYLLRY